MKLFATLAVLLLVNAVSLNEIETKHPHHKHPKHHQLPKQVQDDEVISSCGCAGCCSGGGSSNADKAAEKAADALKEAIARKDKHDEDKAATSKRIDMLKEAKKAKADADDTAELKDKVDKTDDEAK